MNNLGELEDNRCEIIYILDEKKKQTKIWHFSLGLQLYILHLKQACHICQVVWYLMVCNYLFLYGFWGKSQFCNEGLNNMIHVYWNNTLSWNQNIEKKIIQMCSKCQWNKIAMILICFLWQSRLCALGLTASSDRKHATQLFICKGTFHWGSFIWIWTHTDTESWESRWWQGGWIWRGEHCM